MSQPRCYVTRSEVRKPRSRHGDLAGRGSRQSGTGNRNHVEADGLVFNQINENSKIIGNRNQHTDTGTGTQQQQVPPTGNQSRSEA